MTATIIHRARGPEAVRDRARRQAARELAHCLLSPLLRALEGRDGDFVIEVCRAAIRGLSKIVEANGDASRAVGILAGATADLTPGWRAAKSSARVETEALFGEHAE